MRRGDRTVYSSEKGRICPHCGLPSRRCQCRANPRTASASSRVSNAEADGIVRVGRTSRGRGGKTVTVVSGLQLPPTELRDLAKALKRRCGTGGAIKDENIEIQGDQRDTVIEELEERGLRVKRTGG